MFQKITNNNNTFEQSEILVDKNKPFESICKIWKTTKLLFFLNNDILSIIELIIF